jgi:protein-S-isoprenylcysteine O-methyltransferase Ste14
MTSDRKTAGVVPPPVIFVVALAAGLIAHRIDPHPVFYRAIVGDAAGTVLIALGLGLSGWMMVHFRGANTPVSPLQPTRGLVVSGPYRFSRNPDYLGQCLVYVGLALVLNSLWVLTGFLPAALLIHFSVIPREEKYLRACFGDEYERYRRSVRRWL